MGTGQSEISGVLRLRSTKRRISSPTANPKMPVAIMPNAAAASTEEPTNAPKATGVTQATISASQRNRAKPMRGAQARPRSLRLRISEHPAMVVAADHVERAQARDLIAEIVVEEQPDGMEPEWDMHPVLVGRQPPEH